MRIVVVGATGNAGTALLHRLHAAEEVTSIVGISRRGPERDGAPYDGVEWQDVDISDPASPVALRSAMTGADVVVQLAWAIRPNRDEAFLERTNVDGSRRVFEAAAAAGVGQLVVASSVGAYGRPDGARPGLAPADESFPTHGVPSSHYARQKAAVERILDEVAAENPDLLVTRLRPGLIFQEEAGAEIRDYFLGSLVPRPLLRLLGTVPLPLLPWPEGVATQAVHAEDVAEAYWLVIRERAGGAFNVAADPPVTPHLIGTLLGARRYLPLPVPLVRAVVSLAYHLRLEPTDPGWVDMARTVPLMDTRAIRETVGWEPQHSGEDALRAVLAHLGEDGGLGNAKHRPRSPWV